MTPAELLNAGTRQTTRTHVVPLEIRPLDRLSRVMNARNHRQLNCVGPKIP